jgi:hypothetical protein
MKTPLFDDTYMVASQEFGEDISMKSKAFVSSIGAVGVSIILHSVTEASFL